MKRVILQIGFMHFVMRNEAQATAALKALSGAVRVREHYSSSERCCIYVPESDRDKTLSVTVVDSSQVRLNQKQITNG